MRVSLWRACAVVSLALLAQGCDRICKIDRTVSLPRAPARAEVEAALKEVPGVERVSYQWGKDSRGSPYERYIYFGERFRDRDGHAGGVLEIRSGARGGATLEMYVLWINRTPSRQLVDCLRAGMDDVYAGLSKREEGMPPASSVWEELIGIPDK
jgi:hypothetical protein